MRSHSILALLSLCGLAAAIPIEKRVIAYVTVTDIVIETVDEIVTVWVTPGAPVPSTAPAPVAAQTTPAAVQPTTAPPVHPTAPTPVAPPAVIAPPPVVAPPPVIAPPPVVTPIAAPPVAPPVAAPPSPSPTSNGGQFLQPPAPTSIPGTVLPGASASDACTPGVPCVGDITFFDPSIGVGACGPGPGALPNGTYAFDAPIVAISKFMMGTLSSGIPMNPLCFRKLSITNPATGKTVTATATDKCQGCKTPQSLDLTEHLFNELGVTSDTGTTDGIQWYWLD